MGFRAAVKKVIPKKVFKTIEPAGHLAEAVLMQTKAGFPARGLKVIGVTGTSGKTTTTTLMANVLKAAGFKTAYFTTVEHDFGDGSEPNLSRMTTLGAAQLTKDIKRAKDNGVEWLVMEVGSHGLAQYRVWAVPFKAAIITNLSHEHLDYHGTFEAYRAAKQKLFKLTKKSGGVGIVNADDANASYYAGVAEKTVTYGKTNPADVQAKNIKSSSEGSTFTVESSLSEPFSIKTSLPGDFNVSNVLAVSAASLALGIPTEAIVKGVANLAAVSGRMASYKTDKGFTVIIDFAHTPDQFAKIFNEIRPLTKGKLIAVFGKPGQRDVQSRFIQGELAGEYCDTIILTEDDPRDVDNQEIMEQIATGARKKGKVDDQDLLKVDLREEAIEKAIAMAGKGDVVMLLSKGHERTLEVAYGSKPWDEAKVMKDALKKHNIGLV